MITLIHIIDIRLEAGDPHHHRHQIEGGHQLSLPNLHPRAFTPLLPTISTQLLQCILEYTYVLEYTSKEKQ